MYVLGPQSSDRTTALMAQSSQHQVAGGDKRNAEIYRAQQYYSFGNRARIRLSSSSYGY
jgi:hypothetical protein